MRSLSTEEKDLWARVTATIRPLSREPLEEHRAPASPPLIKPRPVRREAAPSKAPARSLKAAATLDSHWDRRLRSGSIEPDRVLDLHGRTLDQAWRAIDDGLEQAKLEGERVVLLITGHSRPGGPAVERGKIRAAVHDWLAASRHSSEIAAVRGAHRRHGGGGSLYIILRRKRVRSTFS